MTSFCSRLVVFVAIAFLAGTNLPTCFSFPWKDDNNDNEYEPPQEGQLRSPCPAINTVANHGYIDRSGKDILLQDLSQALDDVWGLPGALILAAITFLLPLLGIETEFTKDGQTLDLDALFKHKALEHDASLVREDFYFEGNSDFSQELFDQCLGDKDSINVFEIAACNRERILDSRRNNPTAYDGLLNINFGALAAGFETAFAMIFGDSPLFIEASKDNLESVYKFGRIPDGYRRRTYAELVPFVLPVSVTMPSAIKALLIPVKKSDGSISAPEIPETLIPTLKTLVVEYSSEMPESFVAVAEALIADLEKLASSQNLEAHM